MDCFARQVNWFGKTKSREELAASMKKDFALFLFKSLYVDKIDIKVSGDKATALFDKKWIFCEWGKGEDFCGSARSRYGFIREDGSWRISSVEDLEVYKAEKGVNLNCCEF